MIRYASGLKIVGNWITNVHPFPTSSLFLTKLMEPFIGFESKKAYLSVFSSEEHTVPGALTGIIEVSDNVIDLAIDPNVPSGPVSAPTLALHSPRNTFGEGIFAGFTTGASIVISGNYVTNCSRNQIEVFDNYLGANGQGSVLIEGNTVITPQDGIANATAFCPNGITAGWVFNPSAANDPAKNPKYTISHNYIENNIHPARLRDCCFIRWGCNSEQ